MLFDRLLSVEIGLIFFQTIIIITAFFVLKKVAWKPLLAFIEKEEKNAEEAIINAARAKKSVNELEKMREQTIARVRREEMRMLAEAKSAKEAILQEAMEEKAKRIAVVSQVIVQKEAAMREQLRYETAALVVAVTKKLVGIEIKQKKQQEVLIRQLIQETAKS